MKPKAKAAASSTGPASGKGFLRRRNVRTFFLPLALISLAAVLLRGVMSVQVVDTDPFAFAPPDVTDMATYHALARGILNGVFPAEFVYQPFYYAVFLPAVKFLLRSEYLGVGIAQSVCAGVIVWCAGLIGAMLRSRRTGLLAAGLCAFSTMLFFYVPYALIEIQQAMWFTLLLYFTLRAMRTGRPLHFTLAGVILSFAILSRGNAWCFLPAVVLAFVVTLRRKRFPTRGKAVLAAVLCLAAIILPQMPFALKNTLATHSLSGPSTAGPAVLTLGNNPESPPGGLPIPYPPTYDEWMDHAAERSVPLRILDWFRAEPAAFLQLQAEKFFLFFDSHEIPNNLQLGVNATKSSIFRIFGIVPTGLLIMLALAGFFLAVPRLKKHPGELLLYLFIFLYVLATVAFYVLARFRVPVIPIFAVGAAVFVADLVRTIRGGKKNRRRLLLHFCPALLAGAYFAYFFYPSYRVWYEPGLTKLTRPDGVRLETASRLLVHDNGPNYLDGWSAFHLFDPGKVLFTKSFSTRGLDLTKYKNAFLTVYFYTEVPCTIRTVCNGKTFTLPLIPSDQHRLPVIPVRIGPFPVTGNPEFSFEFPQFDFLLHQQHTEEELTRDNRRAIFGVMVDYCRDYGRTTYLGNPFPSEAVVTLELEP